MVFKITGFVSDKPLRGERVIIQHVCHGEQFKHIYPQAPTYEEVVLDTLTMFVTQQCGNTLTGKIVECERPAGLGYLRNQHPCGVLMFETCNILRVLDAEPERVRKENKKDKQFYNTVK